MKFVLPWAAKSQSRTGQIIFQKSQALTATARLMKGSQLPAQLEDKKMQ